jgi:hypothetical protein
MFSFLKRKQRVKRYSDFVESLKLLKTDTRRELRYLSILEQTIEYCTDIPSIEPQDMRSIRRYRIRSCFESLDELTQTCVLTNSLIQTRAFGHDAFSQFNDKPSVYPLFEWSLQYTSFVNLDVLYTVLVARLQRLYTSQKDIPNESGDFHVALVCSTPLIRELLSVTHQVLSIHFGVDYATGYGELA